MPAEKPLVLDYASAQKRRRWTRFLNWGIVAIERVVRWLAAPKRIRVLLAGLTFIESIIWQIKHNPVSFLSSLLAMISWLILLAQSIRRKTKGLAWRVWVWVFFFCALVGNAGYNECPHARYIVVGGTYWTLDGKECGNGGHNYPFARKLWMQLFNWHDEYYGWTGA